MTHQTLNQVANINGGGLSVLVSGKYTSVRHERARIDGKHTADMPTEIPYKERLLDKLNNAYNMLKSVEFYLDRTAFKNKYQEKFSKEKLLTEKILGL